MKNIYYASNWHSGKITTGGFCSLEDAQEYVKKHGGNLTIFVDCRESPHKDAQDILRRVWGSGQALTSFEYEILVRLAKLNDRPCADHPNALNLVLALSGLLSKWEADNRPRENGWFLSNA